MDARRAKNNGTHVPYKLVHIKHKNVKKISKVLSLSYDIERILKCLHDHTSYEVLVQVRNAPHIM